MVGNYQIVKVERQLTAIVRATALFAKLPESRACGAGQGRRDAAVARFRIARPHLHALDADGLLPMETGTIVARRFEPKGGGCVIGPAGRSYRAFLDEGII